jgi:hypothetical protein
MVICHAEELFSGKELEWPESLPEHAEGTLRLAKTLSWTALLGHGKKTSNG